MLVEVMAGLPIVDTVVIRRLDKSHMHVSSQVCIFCSPSYHLTHLIHRSTI